MGPLLVGAAGADVGARGCCGSWSRRRPRRFAPAALGTAECGRQLRRVAPAAWDGFGVGANRGLILFREVNDLI